MKKSRIILLVFISLILGMSFAGIAISHTGSPASIGGTGAVYDFTNRQLTRASATVAFTDGAYKVREQNASLRIKIDEGQEAWKYFYIDVKNISSDKIQCKLSLLNSKKRKLFQEPVELANGRNVVTLSGEPFTYLKLGFSNQKGVSFAFTGAQLREEEEFFSKSRFLTAMAIFAVICMLVLSAGYVGFFCIARRWRAEAVLDFFQEKYGFYGDLWGSYIAGRFYGGTISALRVLLFLFLILYYLTIYVLGMTRQAVDYKVHSLMVYFLLVLLAGLCWEGKLKRRDWNTILFWSWAIFWMLACISDFIVTKRYGYVGYGMIIFWGFFFFLWGNMEEPAKVLDDLCRALMVSFGIVAAGWLCHTVSIFVIPQVDLLLESSGFAVYLNIVLAAFLASFLRDKYGVLGGLGTIVCMGALWMTQSIFAVLSGIAAIAVCLLCLLGRLVRKKEEKKTADMIKAVVVICIAVIAVRHGHFEMWISGSDLSAMWHDKCMVWKQYIRSLNFWGHPFLCKFHGDNAWPQNGILAIAYRYGVPAIVPYVILGIRSFCGICRAVIRKEQVYFPLLFWVSFWILNLFLNVEKPYLDLGWVIYFLLPGWVFAVDAKDWKNG